jgi:TrmH family RNA methyltransferase
MIGRTHPSLRRVRELRKDRRARDVEGVFVAEGIHLAEEALRAGADVETAVISPRLSASDAGLRLRRDLERAAIPLIETTDAALDGLSDARSPQPVLLVVRARRVTLDQAIEGREAPALLAVLHGVQDPGNLGTVLRTADAASATGLVIAGAGADLHHPRAVRATAGSIFRLPAAACRGAELFPRLRDRGILLVAADPRSATDYASVDLRGPVAIFLGGEGSGLPSDWLDLVDRRVRVPMRAGVESLSVGAAAAVLLFEARRQRSGDGVSCDG